MVKLIAASFRAKVRRAMVGRIPFSTRADIKVAQRARTCAGRYRSTFEEILQISIVVVIQTAYRHALAVALQFAAHRTVLPAVVGLDGEATVGP